MATKTPTGRRGPRHRKPASLCGGLCISLLLASSLAQAEIYRWVDAQGVAHYGEQPPADHSFEVIEVPSTAPAANAGTTGIHQALSDIDRKSKVAAAAASQQSAVAGAKAQNCEMARTRLQQLAEHPPGRQVIVDDQGIGHRMEPAEYEQEQTRMQQVVTDSC